MRKPSPGVDISPTEHPDASFGGDEALMKRITLRQPGALNEFYARHARSLRGLILSVVHEEAEADDVLQESLLQIWREAHRYSPQIGKPLSWVTTIVRRRAIDRVRRRNTYRRAKQRFEDERKPSGPAYRADATASAIADMDLRRFLGRHMQSLPSAQREAVELAYFSGLSQREIAASTHTPLGTVKTRLQLGLRKLSERVRPMLQTI